MDASCFKTAARYVAVVQVSSCFIERVFSQMLRIEREIGVAYTHDNLQLRALRRCNAKARKILEAMRATRRELRGEDAQPPRKKLRAND